VDPPSKHDVEMGSRPALRVSDVTPFAAITSLLPRNRFGSLPVHRSVNIGGWFVLEPFITPALFQKYPDAIDEWTLSTLMAADTASGGINQLEQHYDTFVVCNSIL
jgi:hypothetical protein